MSIIYNVWREERFTKVIFSAKTSEAWKQEDVSLRWREATAKELEKYSDLTEAGI